MLISGARRDAGPVAPSDELCAKPGSEPSLANAQGQRWSLGWVFSYIPKKRQPALTCCSCSASPMHCFLQRGKMGRRGLGCFSRWPQPFWEVSSDTISAWSVACRGGWRSSFCSPPPRTPPPLQVCESLHKPEGAQPIL